MTAAAATEENLDRSGPWTDLALTMPVFIGYHLGVVFLPYRNAADWVTQELQALVDHSMPIYALLTVSLGAAYVVPLLMMGRGKHISWHRFAWMGTEGILYAVAMRILAGLAAARLFSWVTAQDDAVGLLRVAPALSYSVEQASEALDAGTRFTGVIMSLGAGFYEELTFRALLYGGGAALLIFLFNIARGMKRMLVRIVWALVAAIAFSAWHHYGAFGEDFDLKIFCFRAACGLVFTVIYELRGLAPAVWTHALYDLWVMAF
ncbi:MAG: hypothetical protein B6A08_09100 [Sorangiineae bacterium NIC37A_2]|jgi:membrane protease YdiL (CAAX protease family)|nr:MAG: hypothetical protein B6A08_09100 [Sorangiineae bacterium NIC37A_2]